MYILCDVKKELKLNSCSAKLATKHVALFTKSLALKGGPENLNISITKYIRDQLFTAREVLNSYEFLKIHRKPKFMYIDKKVS
jgi:hypothetical protein